LRAERAGVLSAFKVLPDSVFAVKDFEVLDRETGKAGAPPER
jgi:hypothetical protein